jgi:hypothetical protein
VVSGRAFWVYPLKRFAAFPLKSGDLTIGAMTLTLSRETVFDIFDPSRAEPSLTRTGVPVLLHVKPLPAESKPQGDIAVGSFELTAQLDRNQAATGDALTLTATVRGKGNVGALRIKDPAVTGLDILQPETHEVIESPGDLVQGTRTFAWLVVPRAPGRYQIPALTLDVFDPSDRAYHHVTSAPITLTAAGNARPETVTAAATAKSSDGETTPQDKTSEESWAPIRTRSALLRSRAQLHAEPWYPWALAAAPLLWLLSISIPALRRRVLAKRAQGGPREALRIARKQLAAAESAVRAKDPKRFHAEIASALHLALDARLGVTVLGLTRPQLRELLHLRGLAEAQSRELLDVLERCDFARFSSAATSETEMQQMLARANQLFEELVRFAPKEAA